MTPRRSPDVMRMTSGVLRHVALPAILGVYAVMVLQRTTDGPARRSSSSPSPTAWRSGRSGITNLATLIYWLATPALAEPADGCIAGRPIEAPRPEASPSATKATDPIGDAGYLTDAPTNSALRSATAKTGRHGVMRTGYYGSGDSPPLLYLPSRAPCSLNAGSGDGGSQVPSADGGCWVAAGMVSADVREWGVSGAAADNAPAINAAIAYAIASGVNDVTLPPYGAHVGTIKIMAPTNTFRLHGATGPLYSASLVLNNPAQTGIDIIADTPVILYDFSIRAAANARAGSCISLTGASTANGYSRLRDLVLIDCFTAINTISAFGWRVEAVDVQGIINAGLVVANEYNVDSGDSSVSDSLFELNPSFTNYGILQYSSGGLKISNTKILSGAPAAPYLGTCYRLSLAPGAYTSDLLASNVSCENVDNGFMFTRQGTTGMFIHAEISGAQFAEVTHPIIEQDSGQPWLTALSVVGGSMQINSGGEGFSLGAVSQVSVAGADILCARGTCTGLTAGRGTTGWAILANYATTPFGSIGPGFTAINAGAGGLTINQGGAEGVTCSGALSAHATVTNGVVTHC